MTVADTRTFSRGIRVSEVPGLSTGKRVRLNRIFGHPSGNLCSVAVDHFIGYGDGMPDGLRHLASTIDELAAARPDAITMHKGPAEHVWPAHAGSVPLIIQSSLVRPDDSAIEQVATAEDAIRLGADAIAVVAYVRGATEARYLRAVADVVRDAARFELPVICHVYPRDISGDRPVITYDPEGIAWAVRCVYELGPDVVKVPYCGDLLAYAQVVADCPVPLVAAGGPRADSLGGALAMIDEVMRSGAQGATIGRNVWGFKPVAGGLEAFKAVIHDRVAPEAALALAR
jgi:class I fructose-bisphosphate aldolase